MLGRYAIIISTANQCGKVGEQVTDSHFTSTVAFRGGILPNLSNIPRMGYSCGT